MHQSARTAEVDHPTSDHRGPDSLLDSLQHAEEPIDRTPGRTGGALVDADHEEVLIEKIPPARERGPMRGPGQQEGVDRREESRGVDLIEGRARGEDPAAGVIGELIERDERHRGSKRCIAPDGRDGQGDPEIYGRPSSNRRASSSVRCRKENPDPSSTVGRTR